MFCLEPLLLAGYLAMASPNREYGSNLNGATVEAQSCERGPGVSVKGVSSGVYMLAAQYGFQWALGDRFTLTLQPKAGGAYLGHRVNEQQSQTNFYLGAQALLGYDKYYGALGYDHISNAGLGERNAGLDMVGVSVGLKF